MSAGRSTGDGGATRRARVVVSGRVQGVNFRYGTVRAAEGAGVAGWVRNNPDGTVEAVFEGSPDAVERMVEYCRRGPPGASVGDVRVDEEEPGGDVGGGFRVRG